MSHQATPFKSSFTWLSPINKLKMILYFPSQVCFHSNPLITIQFSNRHFFKNPSSKKSFNYWFNL